MDRIELFGPAWDELMTDLWLYNLTLGSNLLALIGSWYLYRFEWRRFDTVPVRRFCGMLVIEEEHE
jgi:hypothetical protein